MVFYKSAGLFMFTKFLEKNIYSFIGEDYVVDCVESMVRYCYDVNLSVRILLCLALRPTIVLPVIYTYVDKNIWNFIVEDYVVDYVES